MKTLAAGLALFLFMGCALTDWLIPSGALSVPPMTLTYTPYPEITYAPPIPTYTLTPMTGVYQAFEQGFMVVIEGQNCLYAFAEGIIIPEAIRSLDMGIYRYCVEFADLPPAPADAPVDPFGRVWNYYPEMRASLGVAVGAPERYHATIPRSEPIVMGGVFYSGMVTLPDGRQLYCGTRGATAGRCEVR